MTCSNHHEALMSPLMGPRLCEPASAPCLCDSKAETLPFRRVQDWTTQVSEDAEGVVSFQYRTKPDDPPDVQTIQKQMAIVAWQPGPNRIVQVPDTVSIFSQHAHTCP